MTEKPRDPEIAATELTFSPDDTPDDGSRVAGAQEESSDDSQTRNPYRDPEVVRQLRVLGYEE